MVTDLTVFLAVFLLVILLVLFIRFLRRSILQKDEEPPIETSEYSSGAVARPEIAPPTAPPPSGGFPCPRCGGEMRTGYMLKPWGTMAQPIVLRKPDSFLDATIDITCDVCPRCGHISLRTEDLAQLGG